MRLRRYRNPALFMLLPALLLLIGAPAALAVDAELTWSASTSEGIIGYRVYAGTASRIYNAPIAVGNQTQYTMANLTNGTWYFAVTAVDINGNESDYSNEASKTVGSASDTTAPVISYVAVSGMTGSGATIKWTTNEASNTQVEYGATTAYGKSTTINSSLVTSHIQTLSGLSAGMLHHYRVKSKDAAGNLAVSADYTFTTAAATDATAPVISGVTASGLTSSGATIAWTTNEASNTQVEYGPTTAYGKSTTLSSAQVTSHSQSLSGLEAGTVYHYRVKSKDASGNAAVSGDYTFTTKSSAEENASRFARWLRYDSTGDDTSNEPDPDKKKKTFTGQQQYLVSSVLESLREKLQGASASPAQAERSMQQTADMGDTRASHSSAAQIFDAAGYGDGPVISTISVSDLTAGSARISWNTDRPSDSGVEYWKAGESARRAVLGNSVTRHSILLNNLERGTRYQFTVQSAGYDGLQSRSRTYSFNTPAQGTSAVALPRFFDRKDQSEMGDEVLTEIAMTNLGGQPATLLLTALDDEGKLIAGPNIVNPTRLQVSPKAQSATLDLDIFGEDLLLAASRGWIKVESTTPDVGGFSLAFGSNLDFADGTAVGDTPLTDFAFTDVEPNGATRINLANNNRKDATVVFDLVNANGTVGQTQSRAIPANGAFVGDLFTDVFPGIRPDASGYVRVNSTEGMLAFEMMKKNSGDMASLPGQDLAAGAAVLYSPHYVTGSEWATTLSVVNLDARPGRVQLQFIGENGAQIGLARSLEIAANGKLHINDPAFFGQNPDGTYTGHVRISSDGVRLAGSAVFGHSNGTSFSSALPLIANPQKSVLYGHAVSNDLYRSGIAIVNPNTAAATAVVSLYAADGTLIAKKSEFIQAGRRTAKQLTEFFPSQAGKDQTSGYVKVTSDKPLASYSLFGTSNLSVLSAIPAKALQ